MAELRFDDRVVVVTGAGGGLGRSHALQFAARGAKVVVNDLGGSATGDGKSTSAADKVVDEIRSAGGTAVANHDSVEDGDKIIRTAIESYGRVDVVVNNAGILRDVSFPKMTDGDWDLIFRVHVRGAYKTTKAAWDVMRDQGFGRVIFTASAAGIYGNFGQANYGAAKLGLLGLSNTLALEGAKRNIVVNTIAPIAGSRLTETILPPALIEALQPEVVSPLVLFLCHEENTSTGGLYEVGGGFFAKVRWERSEGVTKRLGRAITVDDVAEDFDAISDFSRTTHPSSVAESMAPIMDNVEAGKTRGANALIDADLAHGYELPSMTSSYTEKDLALYALGVGAAANPLDDDGLRAVYELHGDGMQPIPSYGVIPAINTVLALAKEGQTAPGLKYGFDRILHGEQSTELVRPLPTSATLRHESKITDIFDKGKNAVVVTETCSYDEDDAPLIINRFSMVVRGAGGFGGERGPTDDKNTPPDRKPDFVVEERVPENQALLYRLSGDWNPLHADPGFASAFGFERPILHGLCTYGYACRHVIKSCAPKGDARFMKKIETRFADPVIPGETLVTEIWRLSSTHVVFQTKVKERDKVVLSKAAVEFFETIPVKKPKRTTTASPKTSDNASSATAKATPPAPVNGDASSIIPDDVFAAIGDHLAKNPAVSDKVQTIYRFELLDPSSTFLVDVKAKPGRVEKDGAGAADCTLSLAHSDFMAMVDGKADAQKLYFSGKLKISGNIMASQKLTALLKLDPAVVLQFASARTGAPSSTSSAAASSTTTTDASSSPTSSTRGSDAPAMFEAILHHAQKTPSLSNDIGAVLHVKLTEPKSEWTLDFKSKTPVVDKGAPQSADVVLSLAEIDFAALLSNAKSAALLFQQGKLVVVDGDIGTAKKIALLSGIR